MKLQSMEELLIHECKDLLSAEKQLVKALPKMAKGAANETLSAAFTEHLEQTKTHVERLEQVISSLGASPRAEHCKGMEGLIEEGADLLEEDADAMVKDAALIGAAQKVEHYEISGYGTARTLAQILGQKEAVKLLQQTLDEEKETDAKLTKLALSKIRPTSASSPK
jgi:ferritin-like metal-binding protein YciE